MKLIDEKFATIRGEHKLYTVRSNRHTGCFMIVDRLRNFVLADGFATRESAWEYLREERPEAAADVSERAK